MKNNPNLSESGFSLVELLVVLAVASILIAFTANSTFHLEANMSLTSSGDKVVSKLLEARQKAIATSSAVEFRFLDLPGKQDDPYVSVIQIARQNDDGSYDGDNPITLPAEIGISRNSKITNFFEDGEKTKMLIRGTIPAQAAESEDTEYLAFRFHPDGSTGLTNEKWFLTLTRVEEQRVKDIPDNFYTIQIDPVLGQVQTYRP